MAKNKTNKAWINRHLTDHYVHLAQRDGYRSRAAYKLIELDDENQLFNNVSRIVDLGCAPGSWLQVAIRRMTNKNALIIGLDLLEIEPIANLRFIHGDFTDENVHNQLVNALEGYAVDLLISDIAPNLTGIRGVDQARSAYIVELVLEFAQSYLKSGGNALIKVFQGGEFDKLIKLARSIFSQVLIKKPDASRSESAEVYLLCKNKIS
ncbi:MAG: RlmE family RNA methyltransferase [Burkholderiales bacterium]|nr:RlmE family RNA methyltransferase [Burkholderiales bacterium]